MPASKKVVATGSATKSKGASARTPIRSAKQPAAVSARSAAEVMLPETSASVARIASELRRWTGSVLGIAGSATELSLNLAKAGARGPRQKAAIAAAGSILKNARETAGMTTREVGKAIDLNDIAMLEQAEGGKVALPFEVILRLAAVLGRHDPLTFAMRLARSTNPGLWKGLEDLGVGRFAVQAGRERELANIYRANDAARKLTDQDFAAVLAFVKTGFDAAVLFRGEVESPAAANSPKHPHHTPATASPAQGRRK